MNLANTIREPERQAGKEQEKGVPEIFPFPIRIPERDLADLRTRAGKTSPRSMVNWYHFHGAATRIPTDTQLLAACFRIAHGCVDGMARSRQRGSGPVRAIAKREHLRLHIAALDVDSDESVRNAFTNILAEAGRIDVLVNNAGISGIGPV